MLQPNKVYGYTCQCRDLKTGKLGCFIIHNEPKDGAFYEAISPIFPDLAAFYGWCNHHGIITDHSDGPWTCRTTKGLTDLDLYPNWPSDELIASVEAMLDWQVND